MSRTLVVCYSRTGATNRVAIHLAEALGADLERIEDARSRAGLAGYAVSALEALAKGLPTIHASRDPADYDRVVLGTPVWFGTMSSPVRSYLALHAPKLRHVAFFAVMRGRGGRSAVSEMQAACGAGDAPSCILTEREVLSERFAAKCASFVRSLDTDGSGRHARGAAA